MGQVRGDDPDHRAGCRSVAGRLDAGRAAADPAVVSWIGVARSVRRPTPHLLRGTPVLAQELYTIPSWEHVRVW